MTHPAKTTPKDVFLYLLMIVTLIISVVSVITLLFQYVNALFPENVEYSFYSISSSVRNATASLFVAWPVFLVVSWLIYKDQRKEEERRDIRVRKWLIYLTLFVAAITLIIDLIVLINNFLGGELTVRFVLKVLSVFVVAGTVFGYFLWEVRRDTIRGTKVPAVTAYAASAAVLAVVIASFFVMGTPGQQRAQRQDERRIQDLQMLQTEIVRFWQEKDRLPEIQDELKDDLAGLSALPTDPQTEALYEYEKKSDLTFALCAAFSRASESYPGRSVAYPYEFGGVFGSNWEHEAGRTCFERTIDPERLAPPGGIPVPKRFD